MTRRALTIPCIATVMALGAFDANAAQPAEVVGVWLNPQGTTRVRIGPCGPAFCGTIVWLQTSTNPQTGEPLTDTNNPDPANRNRPILGMQILTDMKPGPTGGAWTGKIYAPNDGKIHDATFSMDGPNALKLEGCTMGGLVCRTRTWTRVN
jgi:uncharacterized protein (DUF2147 family)